MLLSHRATRRYCYAFLWTAVNAAYSHEENIQAAVNKCAISLRQKTSTSNDDKQHRILRLIYANKHYSETELLTLPQLCTDSLNETSKATNTVQLGCVVDAINGHTTKPGVAIIELAFDTNTTQVVPFHIPVGRLPRRRSNPVGRWPAHLRMSSEQGSGDRNTRTDESNWSTSDFRSITRAPISDCLPSELNTAMSNPTAFILATDTEPYAFFEAVNHRFPQAVMMGGVAALTPFVTGLSHTLFYNEQVTESGIVGAAITYNSSEDSVPVTRSFPGLQPLGNPMTITRCRGNVIVDLDDKAAISTLLTHYRSMDTSQKLKSETTEYYIGVYNKDLKCDKTAPYSPKEARLLGRVISGDPSRGQVAIDTLGDLIPGEHIQFFMYDNSYSALDNDTPMEINTKSLTWQVSPTNTSTPSSSLAIGCENGIILSTSDGKNEGNSLYTWLCSVSNGLQILK
ncbi:hypothetical protein BDF19DRAFT_435687 [Syncephalis fuscata]|nr:hypothetical protein BDF19DRAFT_435687 [Syncephalis fuscata]